MEICDEKKIRERICELNEILEYDSKNGHLTDSEFRQCCNELHQKEQELTNIYILHHLSTKHKVMELDMSLYPYHEEESDSDMDACKERHEASCNFHKKNNSLQK